MTRTRTPGITVDAEGKRTIDKEHRGIRICLRLGDATQEQDERRLQLEIDRLEAERLRRGHAPPLFSDCAARYLVESRNERSVEVIRWHVGLLLEHFAHVEPHKIHDGTLAPFVEQRLAEGASATTVKRSLEVVRTILNRAGACLSRRRRTSLARRQYYYSIKKLQAALYHMQNKGKQRESKKITGIDSFDYLLEE